MKNYLTPKELAERWEGRIAVGTLANWRCLGCGPAYLKLGDNRIAYAIADVEAWEASRREEGGPVAKRRRAG